MFARHRVRIARTLRAVFSLLAALSLMGLSPGRASPPAAPAATTEVYFTDFESGAGPEWSTGATDVTPVGARTFLGQFSNETVTLSLSGLPTHDFLQIEFDLFAIQSWDGNDTFWGPDEWDLTVQGGPTLLHTTFGGGEQAYPGWYPGDAFPGRTGASEIDTLGYTFYGDAVFHLSFLFSHSASGVDFDFSAFGLQDLEDESWGLDNVRVVAISPPDNDEFGSATDIASLPFSDSIEVVAATTAGDDPLLPCMYGGPGTGQHSVWYSFTPAADATLHVTTQGSNYDTTLAVWTGSPSSLTEVACDDDSSLDLTSTLSAEVTGGVTYYIEVVEWGGFTAGATHVAAGKKGALPQAAAPVAPLSVFGEHHLELAVDLVPIPPLHDDIATPVDIGPFYGDFAGYDIAGATTDPGDPEFTCNGKDQGERTVWYRFTPYTDGNLYASTWDSDYDTVLALWWDDGGTLVPIACNDDDGGSLTSALSAWVWGGGTFYLEAARFSSTALAASKPKGLAPASAPGNHLFLYTTFTPFEFMAFNSIKSEDGWVRESKETSDVGGKTNKSDSTVRVGDGSSDQELRSLLSFDSSALPDNAVVAFGYVSFKLRSVSGTNPFDTHGNLWGDMRRGAFGDNLALEKSDFQAGADGYFWIFFPPVGVDEYSFGWFGGEFVNRIGRTQVRLHFELDDDDDRKDDYLKIWSGEAKKPEDQPQLGVWFYVP